MCQKGFMRQWEIIDKKDRLILVKTSEPPQGMFAGVVDIILKYDYGYGEGELRLEGAFEYELALPSIVIGNNPSHPYKDGEFVMAMDETLSFSVKVEYEGSIDILEVIGDPFDLGATYSSVLYGVDTAWVSWSPTHPNAEFKSYEMNVHIEDNYHKKKYNVPITVTIKDTENPYITYKWPQGVNISPWADITVSLKDDGVGVDPETIEMRVQGEVVTPEIIDKGLGYKIFYDPAVDFGYDELIEVIVEVADLAGNKLRDEYSFRTAALTTDPPVIIWWRPEDGAIDVERDTNIIVHITDYDVGVDPDTIEMTVEGTAVIPEVIDNPNFGYWEVSYDPPEDFANGEEVEVSIKVSDLHGNEMYREYSFKIIHMAIEGGKKVTTELNKSPEIEVIGDKQIYVWQKVKVKVKVKARDPEGAKLIYTGKNLPKGASINKRGVLKWKPYRRDVGTHKIGIEVSDGEKASSATINVKVRNRSMVTVLDGARKPVIKKRVEVLDESNKRVKVKRTNKRGKASFKSEEGSTYKFRVKHKGHYYESEEFIAPRDVTIRLP